MHTVVLQVTKEKGGEGEEEYNVYRQGGARTYRNMVNKAF